MSVCMALMYASAAGYFGRYRVSLLIFDDLNVTANGPVAAELFSDYPVVSVIGAYSSRITIAMLDGDSTHRGLTASGIPLISGSATSPVLSDKSKYPHFMRVCSSDALTSLAMVQMLSKYGVTRIAGIGNNDSYGRGGLEKLVAYAARAIPPIEVVSNIYYSPTIDSQKDLQKSSPLASPDDYVRVVAGAGPGASELLVPAAAACRAPWIHRLLRESRALYREVSTRVLEFPEMRPAIAEKVFGFLVRDLVDNPRGCEGGPRTVFLFEVTPDDAFELLLAAHILEIAPLLASAVAMVADAFELLMAAHILEIAPLLASAVAMVADHVDAVPSWEGVPSDVVAAVYARLRPEDLCRVESSALFSTCPIDTSEIWERNWRDRKEASVCHTHSWVRIVPEWVHMPDGDPRSSLLSLVSSEKSITASALSSPEALESWQRFLENTSAAVYPLHISMVRELWDLQIENAVLPCPKLASIISALDVRALRKLDLSGCCLDSQCIEPIVQLMETNVIEALSLHNSPLPTVDGIAEALKRNTSLTLLDLGWNARVRRMDWSGVGTHPNLAWLLLDSLQQTAPSVMSLLEALRRPECQVAHLMLDGCQALRSSECFDALCSSIAGNSSLVTLGLSNLGGLGNTSLDQLSLALAANKTLTSLNISQDALFGNGIPATPGQMRPFCQLWSLQLAADAVTEDTLQSMVTTMTLGAEAQCPLEVLNLNFNGLAGPRWTELLDTLVAAGVTVLHNSNCYTLRRWRYRVGV
eukprot:m51a1_g8784 putative g-protein coupled receptor family c group 6 member a-like (756) ;mRNA; f:206638-212733